MAYRLLTVDHSHAIGEGVQVAPVVRLGRLVDDGPKEIKPMKGDLVELRLPDGPIRQAAIMAFGLDGWMKDGYFYTASNPADPVLTLRLRDISPDDLPAGTEVWLPDHPSGSRPTAGPCSYCQMMQRPEIVTSNTEVRRVRSSGGVGEERAGRADADVGGKTPGIES